MAYKTKSPIPVVEGGSGVTSTTANAPICGGTTSTGSLQTADSGLSTSGAILTSTGSSSLPTWQTPAISLLGGNTGLAYGDTVTITGGTSGATFTGSGSTLTESFNFLALPTSTSTNGQITINGNKFLHQIGAATVTFINSSATVGGTVTGVGHQAYASGGGSGATAIGVNSMLVQASGGNNNTAFGYQSAYQITTTCSTGTYVGYNVCSDAGTGLATNVAIGANAMSGGGTKTSPTNNVIIGSSSGTGITTGSTNVFLGTNSGQSVTTGGSNISLNTVNGSNTSNQLTIGSGTGTGTQQLNLSIISGIRGTTTVNANAIAVLIDSAGQLGTTSSSIRYKENIEDMNSVSSPIMSLRPVTFDFIDKPNHKKQVGLIAEEVEEIMPDLVSYNQNLEVESVKYQDLSILLLNEIKKALQRVEFLENRLISIN